MPYTVVGQPATSSNQALPSIREQNEPVARITPDCSEPQSLHDLGEYIRSYAREKPGTAALVCLGVGFVLGWRLRLW